MAIPSSSVEARLQAIEDREAIRELLASYALHAMNRDWPALITLFVADGILDIRSPAGGGIHWQGHDEILANLTAKNLPVIPLIHNEIIRIDGDEATCTHVMLTPVGPDAESRGFVGVYSDKMVRSGGQWRFTERYFVPKLGNY